MRRVRPGLVASQASGGSRDAGGIFGFVTDEDSIPVEGVAVSVWFRDTLLGSAATDSFGGYDIEGLPTIGLTVQAEITNPAQVFTYSTTWHTSALSQAEATPVTVVANATVRADIELLPAVSIDPASLNPEHAWDASNSGSVHHTANVLTQLDDIGTLGNWDLVPENPGATTNTRELNGYNVIDFADGASGLENTSVSGNPMTMFLVCVMDQYQAGDYRATLGVGPSSDGGARGFGVHINGFPYGAMWGPPSEPFLSTPAVLVQALVIGEETSDLVTTWIVDDNGVLTAEGYSGQTSASAVPFTNSDLVVFTDVLVPADGAFAYGATFDERLSTSDIYGVLRFLYEKYVKADLSGTVTDINSDPVEDALVQLVTPNGVVQEATTAADGTWSMEDAASSGRLAVVTPSQLLGHTTWYGDVFSYEDAAVFPVASAAAVLDVQLQAFPYADELQAMWETPHLTPMPGQGIIHAIDLTGRGNHLLTASGTINLGLQNSDQFRNRRPILHPGFGATDQDPYFPDNPNAMRALYVPQDQVLVPQDNPSMMCVFVVGTSEDGFGVLMETSGRNDPPLDPYAVIWRWNWRWRYGTDAAQTDFNSSQAPIIVAMKIEGRDFTIRQNGVEHTVRNETSQVNDFVFTRLDGISLGCGIAWVDTAFHQFAHGRIYDGVSAWDDISAIELELANRYESITLPAPTQVDLLAVSSDGVVNLSWDETDSGSRFNLYKGTTSGDLDLLVGGLTDTSYDDTDVVNDTVYYYAVGVENAVDEVMSDEVIGTPLDWSTFDVAAEIASVVNWYDGADLATISESGGLISQWDDKSGEDNHLVPASFQNPLSGTRELNGLNVVEFDGSFGHLITGSPFTGSPYSFTGTELTYFFVAKYDTSAGRVLAFNRDQNDWQFDNVASLFDGAENGVRYGNVQVLYAGSAVSTTAPFLWHGQRNSTAWNGTLNGAALSINTGSATSFDAWHLSVGGQRFGNEMDGYVAEVVVCNTVLSPEDVSKIRTYLNNKWAVY